MQSRVLTKSVKSVFTRLMVFGRWILAPESLDDLPPANSPSSTAGQISFLRFLFSRENLESNPSVGHEPKPSFVFWLMAPEPLESSPPEHNDNASESTHGT